MPSCGGSCECYALSPVAAGRRWPPHAWEPVIYSGGRQLDTGARRADSIGCGVGPLDTLPGRVIGAKPAAVCRWIFQLLGAGPGDTLDDLFPGSGAVTRAWAAYTRPPDPPLTDAHDASRDPDLYASFQARANVSFLSASGGSYPSFGASYDGSWSRCESSKATPATGSPLDQGWSEVAWE